MKFQLTFDVSKKHNVKPTNLVEVNSNLRTPKEVTIEEFSKVVTQPFGFSFTCGIFKENKRRNANWLQQSVFALDFDDGLTPDEAIKIATNYGITPNVVYTSFSDTPELRKFRVLFFLDKVITDKKEAKFIILNLMNMYDGKADKACKDYARMFFGGKECLYLNTEVIKYNELLDVLNTIQVGNDSMKTRKVFDVQNCPNTDIVIYNNNDSGFETKNDTPYNDGKIIKDFDFTLAAKKVKIFNDFLNHKWLYHNELFGLATSLVHIEGGMKLMKTTMLEANKKGTAKYTQNNFGIIPYVNKMKYTPQRLENYSPYTEDTLLTNIITAARALQGAVEEIVKRNNISLTEAENKLLEAFEMARNAEKGVFLFRLPTGLGKTRALQGINGVTMAFPTHSLKDEVSNRMTVSHKVTPKIPEFNDAEITNSLNYFYATGLVKKATGLLSQVAANLSSIYSVEDMELASLYLKETKECYATDKTVLTTHQKAMFGEFNSDTLIFDEDPIQSILSLNTMKLGDLLSLEGSTIDNLEIRKITDFLRDNLGSNVLIPTPLFTSDVDKLCSQVIASGIEINIMDFLNSDFIVKDGADANLIHFIEKRDLPEDKKIIILSATASEHIYRELFKDDLTVVDLLDVEQVGQVIQNTRYSYSRASVRQQGRRISELAKEIGDLPTITFMQHKDRFKNPVEDMHFGNCAGYDYLKGQDIAVVGTPHLSNIVYSLYAKALGIAVKPKDLTMTYQMIEYNGFRFKFMCYDNEKLRMIQLSLIESDLIQAIGRNRTLREDCTTYVYSNFPLRQTTKFIR